MMGFGKGNHPKALIESLSPRACWPTSRAAPLVDGYDIYQHLMDYCAETLQDDAYSNRCRGLAGGAPSRCEIRKVKNKGGQARLA